MPTLLDHQHAQNCRSVDSSPIICSGVVTLKVKPQKMRLIRRFDRRLECTDPSVWTPKLANWMRMIGSIPASPHCQDRQFFAAGHGATFLPRHSMRGLFEANEEKKSECST